jgi:hypothetical protein
LSESLAYDDLVDVDHLLQKLMSLLIVICITRLENAILQVRALAKHFLAV